MICTYSNAGSEDLSLCLEGARNLFGGISAKHRGVSPQNDLKSGPVVRESMSGDGTSREIKQDISTRRLEADRGSGPEGARSTSAQRSHRPGVIRKCVYGAPSPNKSYLGELYLHGSPRRTLPTPVRGSSNSSRRCTNIPMISAFPLHSAPKNTSTCSSNSPGVKDPQAR